MMIINTTTHEVEWNSTHHENWKGDGWVVVPPELEQTVLSSCGYCNLSFDENGNLIGITPTDKPEAKKFFQPTAQDDIATMMIDQEYRLTLLELGLTE